MEHLGTDHISIKSIQKRLYDAYLGVFRHELLLKENQIFVHFLGQFQLHLALSVNGHGFRPKLIHILPGGGFILQNMNLCLFGMYHDGQKAAVAAAVEGQEVQRIGSAAKHALPQPVLRFRCIGNLVGFLGATEERFNVLDAPGIGCGNHF